METTHDHTFDTAAEAARFLREHFADFARTQPGVTITDQDITFQPQGVPLVKVVEDLVTRQFVVEAVMGPHRFGKGSLSAYVSEVLTLRHRAYQRGPDEVSALLFEALVDAQGRQFKAGYELVEFTVDPYRGTTVVLDCAQWKKRKGRGNSTIYRVAAALFEGKWWIEGNEVPSLADLLDRVAAAQRQFLKVVEVEQLDKR